MARGSKKIDFASEDDEILSRLDVFAEYQAMGVRLVGTPRNNKCECYAISRDERKPSAVVFGHTGRYVDKGSGENLSFWDFACKYGKVASDWRSARKHYAEKAGVKLSGGRLPDDPLDSLEFIPWTDGEGRLVRRWCSIRNPSWCGRHGTDAYLAAFQMSGGRTGWLRHRDKKPSAGGRPADAGGDGEKDGDKINWVRDQKVVLLPAYGEKLLDAGPVAWIAWEISGGKLPIYRGKGVPPDYVKMKSVGPTRGTMIGLHGLTRLAEGGEGGEALDGGVELIWSTAGPSDMLAILAAMIQSRPQDIDRHLVLTNASSETGDVLPSQTALFCGHKVLLVRDTDEAGEVSAAKWIAALAGVAGELRKVQLPWPVEKKHGKDARDFLNGVAIEQPAEQPQEVSP